MKKLFALVILFSGGVWASPELTADFRSLVKEFKLGPLTEQSYCYSQDGKIDGYRPNKLQRIASVTKLFTTLLASETHDLHRTFITRVYIGKDALHIEGGRDPYFEEDKLLLLLRALNDLGYRSFKKITFNKDFLFYDVALGEYEKITPEKSRLRLLNYVKPGNQTFVKNQWKIITKFAFEEGVSLPTEAPSLTAGTVSIMNTNPLQNENPLILEHESRPFHHLLKAMNVMSKNYVSENVYEAGKNMMNLSELLTSVGITSDAYKIHNGSGLPIIGKTRTDNQATCETVLKVIELLAESLKKHNLELSDVVAVNGGKDLGSFRTRFLDYPETHEAVISKTGTLKHTSSLAGVLLSDEVIPFAILNHTTTMANARNFQDRFVARMFDRLGTPTPLVYEKISIFPWQDGEFLRPSR